jgi:hypothetical protein
VCDVSCNSWLLAAAAIAALHQYGLTDTIGSRGSSICLPLTAGAGAAAAAAGAGAAAAAAGAGAVLLLLVLLLLLLVQ